MLLEFPKHLSDPELAWPKSVRALLPGPVGFNAIGVLLMMVLGTVAVLRSSSGGWPGHRHVRASTPRDKATRKDLARFIVRRATAGRVTLGRLGGEPVAAEPRHSVLVVGPTQTGKTTAWRTLVAQRLEWSRGPQRLGDRTPALLREPDARAIGSSGYCRPGLAGQAG